MGGAGARARARHDGGAMSDTLFLATLQKITANALSLGELIDVAAKLSAADQKPLARQLYKVWIRFHPEHPLLFVAYYNCAELDERVGDSAAAAQSLLAAIGLKPDFAPAHINLGGILERGGLTPQAIAQWNTVAEQPVQIGGESIDYAITALKQMARVFSDHKLNDKAEEAIKRCLDIDRNQPEIIAQHIAIRLGACKWPIMEPCGRVDREGLLRGAHPLSMTWYSDDPLLQLATAERYVRHEFPDPPKDWDSDRRHAAVDLAQRRLRVGYVSSDLRDHAIGYLMAELFELHDRSRIEIFAYYCGPNSTSELHGRISKAVEHWCPISKMSDDEAAAKIAADGIDILVDVNGHTRDARPGVFARRPAPIQVNWLGYPGTMGTPYHHYIIADDAIIPEGAELYYSEKVLRLACYQPNDRK